MSLAPDLIDFAHTLADAARAETLGRFRQAVETANKDEGGGFDPVTEADRAAERAMRALIERHHPGHGVKGEEFPERPSAGRYAWGLDPIDGTRAFICGLPSWVTLIALLEDDRPVAGIIDAPALGERYSGLSDEAHLDAPGRRPIRTSGCRSLGDARLSTTDPFLFVGDEEARFARLRGAARTVRYGLDGYAYARLAAGSIDLVAESGLKPYDYEALIPVVRAAGGVIGDWQGGDDFGAGRVLAAATPWLFEEAVDILNR
ncbi:inositol monophosphatase family protein [Allosphingosinicella flava]|uniref:Inositol monophosphatase family protein n=1 Tax=Allosphingosinicella flava TaxID=2771430 RepID=A0A7T2GIA0_9SPHN|nr:inositol monophosphatase family protein [Sphingosinicella flava]QPQ54336.1 inositol monophosphatase family protein [Sphingosinicella flava]